MTRTDDAVVIEVARLRSTVVFADDTIGVDADGEPARVDHDVVVTAIVPAREGGVLVMLRPFSTEPGPA
jgi:hypothetical protein